MLRVFPGSERLRYVIPFADPQETIDYLRSVADKHPGAVAVFADDGEKFGVWPETKLNVFDRGWLRQFFDMLAANQEWINMTTPSEVIDHVPPVGKVYLPEGSYREMTEWVLPAASNWRVSSKPATSWSPIRAGRRSRGSLRGGFWRNFKVRVSGNRTKCTPDDGRQPPAAKHGRRGHRRRRRCARPAPSSIAASAIALLARRVWRRLSAPSAQRDLQPSDRRRQPCWTSAAASRADDLGRSGRRRFQFRRPARGATGRRQTDCAGSPPAAAGKSTSSMSARSATICWPRSADGPRRTIAACWPGPRSRRQRDRRQLAGQIQASRPRKAAAVRRVTCARACWTIGTTTMCRSMRVARGEAAERGDFLGLPYEGKLRRNPGRIQVQLARQGNAWGVPLKITKGVTLEAGSNALEIAYLIEGLPRDRSMHFRDRVQFRRHAVRRRRPLFSRRWATASTARANRAPGSICTEAASLGADGRMARHRRRPGLLAAGAASGPIPLKRSANRKEASSWSTNRWSSAALARARRHRWPLERDDAVGARHIARRKPPPRTPTGCRHRLNRARQ